MRTAGIEPARASPRDFKSLASTSFATSARLFFQAPEGFGQVNVCKTCFFGGLGMFFTGKANNLRLIWNRAQLPDYCILEIVADRPANVPISTDRLDRAPLPPNGSRRSMLPANLLGRTTSISRSFPRVGKRTEYPSE